MSLRALKKQQQQLSYSKRPNLYKKSTLSQRKKHIEEEKTDHKKRIGLTEVLVVSDFRLYKQLSGRAYHSAPELRRIDWPINQLRTKSESDLSLLVCSDTLRCGLGGGAKSEICLQTISSHNYSENDVPVGQEHSLAKQKQSSTSSSMISGARSHRELSHHSTYGARSKSTSPIETPRRMSESSLNSSCSQRTSAMSSSGCLESGETNVNNQSIYVGIRGYEVIEERARFTVYKLRVENPSTNDYWLVLRRYTDFVRLNNKLKQAFPHLTLTLPRKKIFGDNFNSVFLDNRVQGLQIFVNSIMARDELRTCKFVREFFCLDEPPSYSESMEECRAIFEAQEETIAHLKMQINSKNELILNLQQKIRDEIMEKEQLKDVIKNLDVVHVSNVAHAQDDGE